MVQDVGTLEKLKGEDGKKGKERSSKRRKRRGRRRRGERIVIGLWFSRSEGRIDGLEEMKAVCSSGDDEAGDLRMPVDFLWLFDALMFKEELRRGLDFIVSDLVVAFVFEGKVPDRDRVVCRRGDENVFFLGAPFDGGDGASMPVEVGHGVDVLCPFFLFDEWR